MTTLKIHNIESAPEASKGLERSQKHTEWFRLHGVLAGAPGLDVSTVTRIICKQFFQWRRIDSSLAINQCRTCQHYCVPAHTGIAAMMRVDDYWSFA
jgi:hypothetical protein